MFIQKGVMLQWRLFFFVAVISGLATVSTQAQSLGVSKEGEGGGMVPEKRQEPPSLKDFFESFGYLITNEFRQLIGIETTAEPRWDSIKSPRDSTMTFIEGMNAILYEGSDNLKRVNQTLPSGYTATDSETLALKAVFDRLGEISPIELPGQSTSQRSNISKFELFPYGVDHAWIWQKLGKAPDGSIVLQREAGGDEWRFTEQTLQKAPALLESMLSIPPVYQTQNKDALARRVLYPMFDRTPWWGWLILAVAIGLACVVGLVTRKQIIILGNRMEGKTKPIIGAIIRSIGTSVAIILGTLVFIVGGAFIELSPMLAQLHWDFIKVVLVIAVIWVFFGVSDLVGTLVRGRLTGKGNEYSKMTVTIIQRVVHTFVFVLLAIFILENLLSFNVGALIAGLGIIGLALSLAGKETAQNLFGAVSIFINRPFVVGDWISYKGQIGEVDDVRMQSTHIRLLSGEMLVVPNMQFVSNEVENLGMRQYLRREMNISLPYGIPPDKVERAIAVLDEILRSDEVVQEGKCDLERRPPVISFSDYGDYYLNIKVYYWYFIEDGGEAIQRNSERGWFSYLEHCTLVNRAILQAFDENDIEFAFPTQTIELEKKNDNGNEDES